MRYSFDYATGGNIRAVLLSVESGDTLAAKLHPDGQVSINVDPLVDGATWAMIGMSQLQMRELALDMLRWAGDSGHADLDTFEGTREELVRALLGLAGRLATTEDDDELRAELAAWWNLRGLPLHEHIVNTRRAKMVSRPPVELVRS